jgi:hypothetical protein
MAIVKRYQYFTHLNSSSNLFTSRVHHVIIELKDGGHGMDKRIKLDLEEVKRLYVEEGLSGREIAEKLNAGKSTILKWVNRMGLSRPNQQHKDKYGRFIKEGQTLPEPIEENHHNWKGGKRYINVAFRHHPNECFHCGSTDNLHVHHIDKNRENNDPLNLRIVCVKCHTHIEHPDNIKKDRDDLGRFI